MFALNGRWHSIRRLRLSASVFRYRDDVMRKVVCCLVVGVWLLAAVASTSAGAADASGAELVKLRAGQVWAYEARSGESDSVLTILRIEKYSDLGTVVHVRVEGIHMVNPLKGGTITDIPHLPFKEHAIQRSVTRLLRTSSAVPDFREGYNTWKAAYQAGQAGAFDMPVRDVLNAMLGATWKEK